MNRRAENVAKCRSCDADIVWVRYVNAAGVAMHTMPLDAAPAPKGNLVFMHNGRLRARTVNDADPAGEPRFLSHFATCPNAEAHRRKRAGGAAAV